MDSRPVTYRAEIIGPVLQSITAGECCSIIGLSGVGKSNMLQHMLRSDVLSHHVGEQAETLCFVMYDTNMLAEHTPWGFFEGLAEALRTALSTKLPADDIERLRRKHEHILAATNHYTFSLRCCAEMLALLCERWRIVVLFDEFDALFASLASNVLRNLRGLRDRHKYRLMYLTFSRQRLASLRDDDDWEEIEPFVELLSLRELGLQPLADDDARFEVGRFAARHGRALQLEAVAKIVASSGGHPALLRALTQMYLEAEPSTQLWSEDTSISPTIQLECTKIWQQLTGDEQGGLVALVRDKPLDPQEVVPLKLKGLVRTTEEAQLHIFSPIFESYVHAIAAPDNKQSTPPIHIDVGRNIVQYYGEDISGKLTKLQHRLLIYLWQHLGAICPVEDVAKAVYPDVPAELWRDDTELDRAHTLVGRLRRRLEQLAPNQPGLLNTIRDQGVRLLGTPSPEIGA